MRGAVSIEVSGVAEIQRALEEAARVAPDRAAKALEADLERVAREAKGLAPVDSGDLRSTIRHEVETTGGRISGAVHAGGIAGTSGNVVDYADVVELGRRDGLTPVQPYLTPAFEANRARILRNQERIAREVTT